MTLSIGSLNLVGGGGGGGGGTGGGVVGVGGGDVSPPDEPPHPTSKMLVVKLATNHRNKLDISTSQRSRDLGRKLYIPVKF